MSNPRVSVSQIKQLIQLRSKQLSTRDIARAVSLSQGAVSKYCRAVITACGTWEAALALEESELERRVFTECRLSPTPTIVGPDCAWIHTEMKRHKHVTLQLLWEEYHAMHGRAALRYSAFCERYRQWAKRLQRSMRQRHIAGEKLFVDYAGRTVPIYGAACEEALRPRSSSAPWARAAMRMRRRRARRVYRTGLVAMCGCWSFMVRVRRSSCQTIRASG
jgi:hypothetical protein